MHWFLELIENLWPLLLILFFSDIGNLLSGKTKKQGPANSPEDEARAQDIREEIRRRIQAQKAEQAKRTPQKQMRKSHSAPETENQEPPYTPEPQIPPARTLEPELINEPFRTQ